MVGARIHLAPSACTADIAHRLDIVGNMNIHTFIYICYVRYVRYVRYWTPRTRVPPGFAKSVIDGRAIRGRNAPDGTADARHRLARVASWLGAAATAVPWRGGRLRRHRAAVAHRLERGDERVRGGVEGSAPGSSAKSPPLIEALASTVLVMTKMRAGSEVVVSTYMMLTACDAQQSHSR